MSKTCVATRAMFDGLLKGIFVYNVEEAALNHSRWDSSRLLHCPSGHSGTYQIGELVAAIIFF